MSFPEIIYRVQYKIRVEADKQLYRFRSGASSVTTERDLYRLYALSRHATTGNLQAWTDKARLPLLDSAASFYNNRLNIFGIEYDFGDRTDWHLDPKTSNRWPLTFWSEVNIRGGSKIGGPKFVWEANRLYGLPILGMAYRQSGEEKYADKICALLNDWTTANPYPFGVNWTSGIELTIRVANLVWGLSFLEGYIFSEMDKENINRFVWSHGRHLYRYPSKYSSNNNHAIAEAFALFLIGVYFPVFPEAGRWLTFGKKVLEREVARQILPDGGSYEYTTTYLSFVFDFFLLFKIVCDKNRIEYTPLVDKRLEQSCEFISSLMDKNGNMPNIGDQDSAVLVNFGLDNHDNFQSILNTGAILYNRPEFRRNNFPDLKTRILLGDQPEREKNQQIKPNPNKNRLFRESGIAVVRGEVNGKEFVFTGNATSLGMPPLYAHGHLDALSFTLSLNGLEFLVDPGTYLYHSGGKWRRYFRSTAAHNTVRINGQDFTEQVADFMFGKPYRITENSLQEEGSMVIWRAGHDAYQRLQEPLLHERRVIFDLPSNIVTINDELHCDGGYFVEQFLHFHPYCRVALENGVAEVVRDDTGFSMQLDEGLEVVSFKGSEKPLSGWYSKAFNQIEVTTTLVCRAHLKGDKTLKTTIKFS